MRTFNVGLKCYVSVERRFCSFSPVVKEQEVVVKVGSQDDGGTSRK